MSCALQHRLGTPQNRPFPQLNLHRARVHRNHGRPRPNGFTGRAQNYLPPLTPYPESASVKPLAFTRHYGAGFVVVVGLSISFLPSLGRLAQPSLLGRGSGRPHLFNQP